MIQFAVEVEWSAGAWTDESAYVLRVKTWAGCAQPGDAVASVGRCEIVLDNRSRRFSPAAMTALAGLVLPRKQVRLKASDGASTWTLWRGFIDAIELPGVGLDQTALLRCVDGLALLEHQRLSADYAESKAVDEAVSEVVTSVYTPPALSIADNGDSLDHYGHVWKPETTRAVDALRQICESVYGRFWVARDGTATFQTRGERQDPSVAAAWELGAGEAAAAYADKVLDYSPMAYWQLNESSGTVVADSSGNDFHGTAYGVTWGVEGIGDGKTAALFDGVNDYVDVFSAGLTAAFNALAGTFSLWCKVSAWPSQFGILIGFAEAVVKRAAVQLGAAGDAERYRGIFWDGSSGHPSDWDVSNTDRHHLALTWNVPAGTVRLFVDGVGQTENDSGLEGGFTALVYATLGRYAPSSNYFFPGMLAHVAVFDSVLSDEAIADLAVVDG